MKGLRLAVSKEYYTTTWKMIHDLSGKDKKSSVKVIKRSKERAPHQWVTKTYSLNGGNTPVSYPTTAMVNLQRICRLLLLIETDPPTREETLLLCQMKNNKAAGVDSAIKAEVLQNGGDAMADIVHDFCTEGLSTPIPPSQWTTSIIVPLPKKGDLSLMPSYRGISLLSITAKVYNKILLKRIQNHVDPILWSNQQDFALEEAVRSRFTSYQPPLTVTFIDFKKAFDSINRKTMFAVSRHYGMPEPMVNASCVVVV